MFFWGMFVYVFFMFLFYYCLCFCFLLVFIILLDVFATRASGGRERAGQPRGAGLRRGAHGVLPVGPGRAGVPRRRAESGGEKAKKQINKKTRSKTREQKQQKQ